MSTTKVTIPPPKGYYEIHAGPLPLRRLRLFVLLADGALWRCSVVPCFEDRLAYYEEHGWDEEDDDGNPVGDDYVQPTGEELRGLMLANENWFSAVNECHWRKIKPTARHVSGPKTEPPDDLMWAVEEQGGTWEILTTMPPEEQYRAGILWRDKP